MHIFMFSSAKYWQYTLTCVEYSTSAETTSKSCVTKRNCLTNRLTNCLTDCGMARGTGK